MLRPFKFIMAGLTVCLLHVAIAEEAAPAPAAAAAPASGLTTEKEKLGYAIGLQISSSLEQIAGDIELAALIQALRDTAGGGEGKMSQEEAMAIQREFFTRKRAEMEKTASIEGAKNAEAGKAFLATNKAVEGVNETASGLQYQVLKAGEGAKPAATDTVTVHYKGTLLNGEQFDSSYDRGEPVSFPLNGVIPGWTEALQLMPVGSKYKLFIPSNLAYGEDGRPGIPPSSLLIFEVELLKIGE